MKFCTSLFPAFTYKFSNFVDVSTSGASEWKSVIWEVIDDGDYMDDNGSDAYDDDDDDNDNNNHKISW